MSLEMVKVETLLISKKISLTFSSNWVVPHQGGCSQFLISSNKFYSSIYDWEYEFSIFGVKYYFLCSESLWVDFRCVHRFQLLNVFNHYVTLPFSPRTERIQGTIQVRLSFQIERFLTGVSQRKGITQPMNQTEWLVLWEVLQTVLRVESSHQTRNLECFDDRYSIPWNLPTIFHPDLIATIRQTYLLSLCVLLS